MEMGEQPRFAAETVATQATKEDDGDAEIERLAVALTAVEKLGPESAATAALVRKQLDEVRQKRDEAKSLGCRLQDRATQMWDRVQLNKEPPLQPHPISNGAGSSRLHLPMREVRENVLGAYTVPDALAPQSARTPSPTMQPSTAESAPKALPATQAAHQIGDIISVLSKTSQVRQCTITAIQGPDLKIHYNGFEDQYDEWIPPHRLVTEATPAPQPAIAESILDSAIASFFAPSPVQPSDNSTWTTDSTSGAMPGASVQASMPVQASPSSGNAVSSGGIIEPTQGPPIEAVMPQRLPARSAASSRARAALCADPRGPSANRQAVVDDTPPLVPIANVCWSPDWTVRLGPEIDGLSFPDHVKIFDKDAVFSVNQAVEVLNRGVVPCAEDLVLAYSASSNGWYLLYKNGRQDLALAALATQAALQAADLPTGVLPAGNFKGGPSQPPLAAGAIVRIGTVTCKITTPLGMGSFGAVWAADLLDGIAGEVAIKEIQCQSSFDLNSATYEGQLLEILGQDRRSCGGASGSSARFARAEPREQIRVPKLIASETEQIGPNHWRVRLAMSKLPGVPLDRFLDWWQRERRPPPDVSATPVQHFAEACSFASELVHQLAPSFEKISAHAFHRDVNSHNILIDGGDRMKPNYNLVDFGLAVDLKNWEGPQVSPSSWHLVDICGDCRYWPMGAWLQFECGWQELAKYPGLATEYQTHLDLHALGITVLQVLAGMAVESPSAQDDPQRRPSPDTENLPEEVTVLLTAWDKYWKDAMMYWERLLECFRNHGDQNSLKGWCISEGVHNIIGQDLADLRTALRMVCDAASGANPSRSTSTAALSAHRTLFETLLELVSAGGVSGVVEGNRAPSWEGIHFILAHDAGVRGIAPVVAPPVAAPMAAPPVTASGGVSRGSIAGAPVATPPFGNRPVALNPLSQPAGFRGASLVTAPEQHARHLQASINRAGGIPIHMPSQEG
jgi:hypothetical protein